MSQVAYAGLEPTILWLGVRRANYSANVEPDNASLDMHDAFRMSLYLISSTHCLAQFSQPSHLCTKVKLAETEIKSTFDNCISWLGGCHLSEHIRYIILPSYTSW